MLGGKRQLSIGLSLSATWNKGKVRQSGDVAGMFTGDLYVELARKAEQAKLDFVFKPDAMYLPAEGETYTSHFASLDPTLTMAALARETERIGLVTTVSTSFQPPYVVARQLQSLHWLSEGRAGWNMVTGLGGAENFSDEPVLTSEQRYAQALEFTDVVHKLWDSYPHEALQQGPAGAQGQRRPGGTIAAIAHQGDYFRVKGPLNIPAHAAGRPPLLQAGASPAGRDFAAATADAVFASTPEQAAAIELRADLRRRAETFGRSPDAIRVLPGLYFFLADTRREAQELYEAAHAHLSRERRYASLQSILGLRLEGLPPDRRVTPELLPDPALPVRSRTHADLLRRLIAERQPTVAELLARPEVIGSGHWVVVGTAEDALRELSDWHEAGALDGVIALPGGSLRSLELFLDELVPMLAEKGLFRHDYTGTTLRDHLGIAQA